MANIDESKFGRLTADLLVRKGDAEPSDIRRARKRKAETPSLNVVASMRRCKPSRLLRMSRPPIKQRT